MSKRETRKHTASGAPAIRLTEKQWQELRIRIESYISRGWDEARVYWIDEKILTSPIRRGHVERL